MMANQAQEKEFTSRSLAGVLTGDAGQGTHTGGEHFLRDSQNIYQTSLEINVSEAMNGSSSGDKRKKIFLHQPRTGCGTEKGVTLRQIITGIKKKAK